MMMMQEAGVAAGLVANAQDSEEDPQFKEYDFFRELDHPYLGKLNFYHPPGFTLSEATAELHRPTLLGEYTEYLCTDILGMPDEEFVRKQQDIEVGLRPGEDMVDLGGAFDKALNQGRSEQEGEEWHPGEKRSDEEVSQEDSAEKE